MVVVVAVVVVVASRVVVVVIVVVVTSKVVVVVAASRLVKVSSGVAAVVSISFLGIPIIYFSVLQFVKIGLAGEV